MDILQLSVLILLLFEIKHYLADKTFQGAWCWGKTLVNYQWIIPLTKHVMVHIIGSFIILILLDRLDLIWLLYVEFIVHFTMDRIKSAPYMLGRFKGTKWNMHTVILDQSVHQLNYFYMVFILLLY